MSQVGELFKPGRIGTLELKNRLVMTAMATLAPDPEGFVTSRVIDYFVERAKGGVGLIITMGACVARDAATPGRLWVFDDKFIPGLKDLVDAVHAYGSRIALQMIHPGLLFTTVPGYETMQREVAPVGVPVSPSAKAWPWEGMSVRELSADDIAHLVKGYGQAARRAKAAGFDAIEIMAGHGNLMCDFLSPLRNKRADKYGGTTAKRARFACEAISEARKSVGRDFPILFRFSGSDFLEGGICLEETTKQAPLFVEAGADALDVTAGVEKFSFIAPTYLHPDGTFAHLAAAIKKVVKVPVIAVGKLSDPVLADRLLAEGKADFIALGRSLLADPAFPNKVREDRLEEIHKCICCNNCLARFFENSWKRSAGIRGLGCTVNPSLLRETEFQLRPATKPKKVLVIGGGLAGLEAARTLAERGHQVSLYEKSDKLGGQWLIASQLGHKEQFASLLERMIKGLDKSGVKVILNTEVSRELVQQIKPDAIIIATGATPKTLDVPGAGEANVVQAIDVFTGKAAVKESVVIIGGRARGMEAAELLATQGKKVSLVTINRLGENGSPLERSIFRTLRDRLIELKVLFYTNAAVREITKAGLYIAWEGEIVFLQADTIVLAVGADASSRLAEELKGLAPEIYQIGDCAKPRDAMVAIEEGAEVARQI